jgi:hypothetical protein
MSHNTLSGTWRSIRAQMSKIRGPILYVLLKQQKTTPSSGSPHAARFSVSAIRGRHWSFG